MNLEVVSYDRDHPSEASVKVSSRSNIRNLVNKTCIFVVKSVTHTHTPTIIFLFNMMFSINHKRSHLVFDYWWHRSHFSGLLTVPYCVHFAMDAERET